MSFKNNLSQRLSLYVSGLSGLIFLVALVVIYIIGRAKVMDNATVSAEDALQTITSKADQIVLDVEHTVNELYWHIAQCEKEEQIVNLAKHLLNSQDIIQSVTLSVNIPQSSTAPLKMTTHVNMESDSLIIESRIPEEQYINQPWYSKPMQHKKPVWCKSWNTDNDQTDKLVCYSAPIKDSDDNIIGICSVNVCTDWLINVIESLRTYKDAEIIMTTDDGYEFITAKSDDGINTVMGRETLVFNKKIPERNWSISMICPKDEVLSDLVKLNTIFGLVMIAGMVLLYVVIRLVVGKITAPLKKFDLAARNIAKGEFDNPLPEIKSRDELYTLAESIYFMQNSLKEYIEQLRITTVAKERIENELIIAASIQNAILNNTFPRLNNFDIYATISPAREVGGDLYDVYTKDNRLWFIVGDVSGKGIPASMYMSVVVFIFRTIVQQTQDLIKIVSAINNSIAANNKTSLFTTMLVGVIDTKTSEMELCNAGHNPPLLKNKTGAHYLKQESNIALGVVENFEFTSVKYPFDANTQLVVYTDGVTESRSLENQEFRPEKLLELVSQSDNFNPMLMTNQIMEALEHHRLGAEQSDDITVLVITKYEAIQELPPTMTSVRLIKPFIDQLLLNDMQAKKLRLAIEELVVNTIHYAQTKESIKLSAIKMPDQVILYLQDEGIAFDPLKAPEADTTSDIETRNCGGLGIFLSKKMTDRMTYNRVDAENIVTMIQTIE